MAEQVRGRGSPWKQRIGYAVGDLGFNFYWQAISLFLYYAYTDILGIPPFWAGVSYAIATLWDAISDPIMGAIADRTKTRWGRYRPYLVIGAIPCGLLFVLSFWAPPLEGIWLFVYATLTHIGLRTFYTAGNIPYIAMTAAITRDPAERSRLAGARMIFASLGGLIVSFSMPALVEFSGADDRIAWVLAAGVMSLLATISFLICFASTREVPQEGGLPPGRAVKEAFASFIPDAQYFWRLLKLNKPLARIFLCVVVVYVSITMFQKCLIYWFKYGLQNEAALKWALPLPALTALLAVPLWVILANRTSKKTVWFGGCALAGAAYLAFFLNTTNSLTFTIILILCASAGKIATNTMFWSMLPDTVEYGEWQLGVRDEAKIFGFAVLGQKAALAVNALLLGQILSAIGFVPNQVQSESVIWGLKATMCGIPFIGLFISVLILRKYDLDETRHAEILAELQKRQAGAA